jgi:hypothetical protein
MSTLARKVFDQVEMEENLINSFWVEQRLQKMQINGLVKMIQGSPKKDLKYIDGYLPRYKWAFRPIELDISGCFDIYCLLQQFDQDFPWGKWEELSQIRDLITFSECISYSSKNIKPLVYAFAMYRGKIEQDQYNQEAVKKALIQEIKSDIQPIPQQAKEKLQEMWKRVEQESINIAKWNESLCN